MNVVFPPTMPHSQVRRSLALILAMQLNEHSKNPISSSLSLVADAKIISAFISERDDPTKENT